MNINILVVARWPLGGIRTYMRYMFSHFPSNFRLTLLTVSTQEDQALKIDAERYQAELVSLKVENNSDFAKEIFKKLYRNRYDLIISQGFVSAIAVHFANVLARVPHMITIHGIVEPQYLEGLLSGLKRLILKLVLQGASVLYGVSNDILEHVYSEFPSLRENGPQSLIIPNGIEMADFSLTPEKPVNLRVMLAISDDVFLFGFFGRFMPQKGFDLIIDAVDSLRHNHPNLRFAVIAVGSGDYIREYQISISKKQLEPFFHFLPFQPMVHQLYPQVDAIIMPSRWEASGLLAMESLCMETPLIASDCIGLRETIADTPTYLFQTERFDHLAVAMNKCLLHCDNNRFHEFAIEARKRFDVSHSAKQLTNFIDSLLNKNE